MIGEPWGLYVHVPWCRHQCPYCAFAVTPGAAPPNVGPWLEQVLREVEVGRPSFAGSPRTLFFGGGTPSRLPVDAVAAVIRQAGPTEEVTLEAVTAQLGAMFGGEVQRQASDLQASSMRIGQRVVKVTDKGGGSQRKASALTEKQAVAMPAELPAALADVRSDATATDWCLCGFEATTLDLVMVGSGTGGVGAMAALLSSDNSFYGLVRTTQIVDPRAPPQVRFVFVSFVGEAIGVMRRAKISTLRGEIWARFRGDIGEMRRARSSRSEVRVRVRVKG